MKIDRFLQLFVVKEKKFYPLYIEQAANIEAAAKFLVELLQEHDPEKQKVLYKNVKEYEHSGIQFGVETLGTEGYNTKLNDERNRGAFIMDASTMELDRLLSRSQDLAKRSGKGGDK